MDVCLGEVTRSIHTRPSLCAPLAFLVRPLLGRRFAWRHGPFVAAQLLSTFCGDWSILPEFLNRIHNG